MSQGRQGEKEKKRDKVSSIMTKTDPGKEEAGGAACCAVGAEAAVLVCCRRSVLRPRLPGESRPRRLRAVSRTERCLFFFFLEIMMDSFLIKHSSVSLSS